MKTLLSATALSLSLVATSQAAPISYGDITGGGVFNGQTTSNSAWAQENPLNGQEMNFWTFTGSAGAKLSIEITSILNGFDAAMSLFFGVVDDMDLLTGMFDNDGDFGSASFVTGSSPFGTEGLDVSLFDILLPSTGIYTLAIGGEDFLNFSEQYGYQLRVGYQVPEPATLGLLLTSLAGLTLLRRKA